ncbi:hypothetical protein D3C73_1297560 [compost metagenome]
MAAPGSFAERVMVAPLANARPVGLAVTVGAVVSGGTVYVWVTTSETFPAGSVAKYFNVMGAVPGNAIGVEYTCPAVNGSVPSVVYLITEFASLTVRVMVVPGA